MDIIIKWYILYQILFSVWWQDAPVMVSTGLYLPVAMLNRSFGALLMMPFFAYYGTQQSEPERFSASFHWTTLNSLWSAVVEQEARSCSTWNLFLNSVCWTYFLESSQHTTPDGGDDAPFAVCPPPFLLLRERRRNLNAWLAADVYVRGSVSGYRLVFSATVQNEIIRLSSYLDGKIRAEDSEDYQHR